MLGTAAVLFALLVAAFPVRAAEDAPPPRLPEVGDWMEYIVAYPLDPLENSLAAAPLPPPEAVAMAAAPGDPEAAPDLDDASNAAVPVPAPLPTPGVSRLVAPEFEAPLAWRAAPVRIVIAGRTDAGFHAIVNVDGERHPLVLPFAGPAAAPPPGEPAGAVSVKIGDLHYDVAVDRDPAPGTGFVRWRHAALPFGLARFATPYVDVILVDRGSGEEPPFPSPAPPPAPPPGGLWR